MALLADIVKLKKELADAAPKSTVHIVWCDPDQAKEAALEAFKARRPDLVIKDSDTLHYLGFSEKQVAIHKLTEGEENERNN